MVRAASELANHIDCGKEDQSRFDASLFRAVPGLRLRCLDDNVDRIMNTSVARIHDRYGFISHYTMGPANNRYPGSVAKAAAQRFCALQEAAMSLFR